MQSMPDTRQQSFDEIYGAPENFLEIEVRAPHFLCTSHMPVALLARAYALEFGAHVCAYVA